MFITTWVKGKVIHDVFGSQHKTDDILGVLFQVLSLRSLWNVPSFKYKLQGLYWISNETFYGMVYYACEMDLNMFWFAYLYKA